MNDKYNKNLIENARKLRNNMTKEERHLWYDFLKNHNKSFLRQKIIGKYIVDFYCASENLVIELDGSQHYEDKGIDYDKKRTEYINSLGIKVVRILNSDVNRNFRGVCEYIDGIIDGIIKI